MEDCQITRKFEDVIGIHNEQCDDETAVGAFCECPPFGEKRVCPSNAYLYNGFCYRIETGSGTWSDARYHCMSEGCEMASPNSVELFVSQPKNSLQTKKVYNELKIRKTYYNSCTSKPFLWK